MRRRITDQVVAAFVFVGEAARRRANYRITVVAFRVALRGTQSGSVVWADVMNRLGVAHKDQGRYADAETRYRAAQAALDDIVDPPGNLFATLQHNFAGLAHARGEYEAGIPHARAAVKLRTSLQPPNPSAVAADEAVGFALLLDLLRQMRFVLLSLGLPGKSEV